MKYRNLIARVHDTPWVITPDKFAQICELLDLRSEGRKFTDDQVAMLLGKRASILDDDEDEEEDPLYSMTPGGVAIMRLHGVISQRMNLMSRFSGGVSTEQFGRAFDGLARDPSVRAIVIDSNSPGGSVPGVPELAEKIFAARGVKPIVAVSNSQMASGAYWIGSAADEIVASPSGQVGSVGVLMTTVDRSRAMQAAGVKRNYITAGRFKALGNPDEALSDEGRARLQSYVDATYAQFLEAIARNRRTTVERVRSGYGEGFVADGREAVHEGLADRVATLEEVVRELEKKTKSISPTSAGAAGAGPILKGDLMDKKILAALVSLGLVAEGASDDMATVALNAFFKARGLTTPTDTAAILSALEHQTERRVDIRIAEAVAAPLALEAATPLAREAAPLDAAKIRAAAIAEERHRVDTIRAACGAVGLSSEQTAELIDLGLSAEATKSRITDLLVAERKPIERVEPRAQQIEKFSAVMQSALDAKCDMAANAWNQERENTLAPEARSMRHLSLHDMACRSLVAAGVRVDGLSRGEVARLALRGDSPALYAAGGGAFYSTGSFANLTLNSARKQLMAGYGEAAPSWRLWVPQGESASDFKINSLVKFGEASDLEMMEEGGKYPEDTKLSDDREYWVVEVFGKKARFTHRMLVNDDTSALARLPRMYGVAAARTQNKQVYAILTGNPVMADGYSLFDATNHQGNVISSGAGAPSNAQLQKMQTVLRTMNGLNTDSDGLNTELRHIIVPSALETVAWTLVNSVADPQSGLSSGVANKARGKNVVVEGLLDAASSAVWYGASDASQMPHLSVRFLQGEEQPVIEDYFDPDTDDRVYKIRQTFATVCEEYRGLVKNNGG